MSRSKLSNTELKFYNTSGETDVVYAKLKGTSQNSLILEGASGATKVSLQNVADPTGTGQVATWDYVNTKVNELNNGLSWKEPVRCKTTANLAGSLSGNVYTATSNGQQTFDGVQVVVGDRVLFSSQTDQTQNGIYSCTTQGDVRAGSEAQAVFERATDADSSAELKSCAVFIESGSSHADTAYVQTTDSPVLGTSNIVWSQFSSAGEILAGSGLSKSGNTISASVDDTFIEIEAGNLTVKSNSITADKIASNTITASEIQDATITDAELADGSCVSRTIADSAISTAKLGNLACTSTKLADGACTADKLASDSVSTVKVLDSNITTAKLADSAVDSDKLASSAVLSSHLSAGSVLTASIGDAQVSTAKIIDANITTAKIASNAITSSKISASNVLTSHIASNQITTDLIANDSVQASHLKSNSCTTDKVQDGAITADKLASNSITTSKMGTLSGLTVNGIVNATAFVASGAGSESDGGFALPKSKSLSIDFNSNQTISGDDTFATIGGSNAGAGVNFAYDDHITLCLCFSVFKIQHTGTNGSNIVPNYEIAYYDGSGNQQSFNDVSGALNDFQLYSTFPIDYQLSHQDVLGDGTTRIASIRLRIKHDNSSDTLVIKDSLQITALAVDDSSGNTNKTYLNGSLS